MAAKGRPTPRVHLHVGLPKSGTTFLQSSLARHESHLADLGVDLPVGDAVMVDAALDVRREYDGFGRDPERVRGAFARVAERVHQSAGRGRHSVLSHELLGAATAEQAQAALDLLAPLEVHLVVTARDPARQALAEWQEGIKHARRLRFEKFTRTVLNGETDSEHARRFRGAQDLTAVLDRWGRSLPPERVHLVTAPPRGTDPRVLWGRFAEALGIDATDLEPAGREHGNASLGTAEISVLRQVNRALSRDHKGVLDRPRYGRTVKRVYAQQVLAGLGSPRPVLPVSLVGPMRDRAELWAKAVDAAGWQVHGDLDDLLPAEPEPGSPHPDDVEADALLSAAIDGTAGLLVRLAEEQDRVMELQAEVERLRRKRRKLKERLARKSG
ncbi:hypothetical protein GCM10011519_12690 [Marmoricola endophyticus]|uniref:Sulfotransferase family protein n=1 Tax=Marmoricola endophyticus TaxID=2040280 RepID=A0A917BEL7_9ACTN|nr:hypothetical protein [Marmoricola endophyticus]GGF40486.1 hypothetical protein GCM10011519_12690 [Marmoricola endophyticus]